MKPVFHILIGAVVITGALFFLSKFADNMNACGDATVVDPGNANNTSMPETGAGPADTQKVNVITEHHEESLFPDAMWGEKSFNGIQFGKLG